MASATIMTGLAPHDLMPNLADLWLFFGSHCYFKSIQKNLTFIHPLGQIFPKTYYQKDFRVDARRNLDAAKPGLPKDVTYSALIMADLQEQHATPPNHLLNSNVIYRVLDWTNTGTLHLSKQASVEKYQVGIPGTMPVLRESVIIDVENAKEHISISSFTPKLPGLTALVDMRADSSNARPGTVVNSKTLTGIVNQTMGLPGGVRAAQPGDARAAEFRYRARRNCW